MTNSPENIMSMKPGKIVTHYTGDIVRRTGLTYMMAETSCFHSATMTVRKLRMDGLFGEIYYNTR